MQKFEVCDNQVDPRKVGDASHSHPNVLLIESDATYGPASVNARYCATVGGALLFDVFGDGGDVSHSRL
jgi:hypothetical protein